MIFHVGQIAFLVKQEIPQVFPEHRIKTLEISTVESTIQIIMCESRIFCFRQQIEYTPASKVSMKCDSIMVPIRCATESFVPPPDDIKISSYAPVIHSWHDTAINNSACVHFNSTS